MDLDLTLRAFQRRGIGNPIEVARDGEEAMRHVDDWEKGGLPPMLVLLDINLPKISGLDVLKRIKTHAVLKTIPVVLLTTSSDTHDVREAYLRGGNSYIVKPVDFDRFLDVVGSISSYWCGLNRNVRILP
jgi:CheY-like chemotaxis protein